MSLSSLMKEYDSCVQDYIHSKSETVKDFALARLSELEKLIVEESENYFNTKDGGMVMTEVHK